MYPLVLLRGHYTKKTGLFLYIFVLKFVDELRHYDANRATITIQIKTDIALIKFLAPFECFVS